MPVLNADWVTKLEGDPNSETQTSKPPDPDAQVIIANATEATSRLREREILYTDGV